MEEENIKEGVAKFEMKRVANIISEILKTQQSTFICKNEMVELLYRLPIYSEETLTRLLLAKKKISAKEEEVHGQVHFNPMYGKNFPVGWQRPKCVEPKCVPPKVTKSVV